MLNLDPYFTPAPLASHMVEAIDRRDIETVIDPAAGDGALLESAVRRWPEARVVASDVDRRRVRALALRAGWEVQAGDFLQRSGAARLARRAGTARTRSVLLNPPFSSRGGTTFGPGSDQIGPVKGSRAMAFLLGSSTLVGEEGQLVALVPASVLSSARDADGCRWLENRGRLEEISRPSKRAFAGAIAETVVLRWTPRTDSEARRQPHDSLPRCTPSWAVVRGSRQMHTVEEATGRGTVRLVHTTNLRNGRIGGERVRIYPTPADRVVSGPAILIPRVGRPDPRKLVVHAGTKVALSDCVFALVHGDESACRALHDALKADFERVRACYGGTGAPYLRATTLLDLVTRIAQSQTTA